MSAQRVLFDFNILIDLLAGQAAAADAIGGNLEGAVSVVTWIEVLAGPATGEVAARALLQRFSRLDLTPEVVEEAVLIRRSRKSLKLPDAVILATVRVHGLTLLTRNSKDFSSTDPGVIVFYEL